MALKTDSNRSECYDFAQMVNHSEIILLDEPIMVYPEENMDDHLLLEACSNTRFNQGFDITGSLYNSTFLQFDNKEFQVENGTSLDENREVKEGLAMLEILHSTSSFCIPEDQPSYVDISEIKDMIESPTDASPIIISDDDDVIFVDCYKESNNEEQESKINLKQCFSSRSNGSKIRRNPVRSARNKSKDFSKDILFEDDFAFLDTSDDEAEEKENQVLVEKKTTQIEKYKEWPVNVHERPEYNAETKTIETFDYTIREIQKKIPAPKKPKLETVIAKKKTKKKYGSLKRRSSRVNIEKKFPLESVRALVNETTTLLKDFFEESRKCRKILNPDLQKFTLTDKLDVLKSQVTLYAVVNGIDFNDVLKDGLFSHNSKAKDS